MNDSAHNIIFRILINIQTKIVAEINMPFLLADPCISIYMECSAPMQASVLGAHTDIQVEMTGRSWCAYMYIGVFHSLWYFLFLSIPIISVFLSQVSMFVSWHIDEITCYNSLC